MDNYCIDWAAVNAIASAVMTIVILTTAIFAFRQWKELEKQRHISYALDQFNQLSSERMVSARRAIFSLPSLDHLSINREMQEEIDPMLNLLNQVGFVLANHYLPETPLLEMFYITAVRCWAKLGSYIVAQRKVRGVYMNHFQWLVNRSLQYWGDEHPHTAIHLFDHNTGKSVSISRDSLRNQLETIEDGCRVTYEI